MTGGNIMYCIKCGADNLDTAKFCRKCGAEVDSQQRSDRRPIVISGASVLPHPAKTGALHADGNEIGDRFGICRAYDAECADTADTGRDGFRAALESAVWDRRSGHRQCKRSWRNGST